MNSKLSILLIFLLMIGVAGQAFGQAGISVLPTDVPKGAYVNGPLGAADDNYFWQSVTITPGLLHANATNLIITLPTGMTVADVDGIDFGASGSFHDEEVTVSWVDGGVADLAFTVNSATDANSIRLDIACTGAFTGFQATVDAVIVMFPVETLSTPPSDTAEYTVAFSDLTDDITVGNGFDITFVDPGPNAIAEVVFTDDIAGNDDVTLDDGEIYPAVGTASYSALADYVTDTVGLTNPSIAGQNLPTETSAVFDGVSDAGDVFYRIYASTDSTLNHVDVDDTGVIQLFNHTPSSNYANEGHTGNQGLTVANLPVLPVGDWYIYVISSLTGDFPLGRSGKLTVKHYPQVDVLAWDYNADTFLRDGTPAPSDNANMVLDSGLFLDIDGVTFPPSAPTDNVDLYIAVDDFDDEAVFHLFCSTATDLTVDDVATSGTSPALEVTGLDAQGATAFAIVDSLLENDENENGFLVYNWSITPVGASLIASGTYTIYAVANDGKNQHVLAAKGFDDTNAPTYSGATQLTMTVKHSPDFVLDSLDEYNLGTDALDDADVTIDPLQTDVVMLSWGKASLDSDFDPDDSCTIEFYIDHTLVPGTLDYGSDDFQAVRDAASAASGNTATGTHWINPTTVIYEDPETKSDQYYVWNLKEDWASTGWMPNDQAAAAGPHFYHIYAIITEGTGATDTKRVACLGISTAFDNGAGNPTVIEFDNAQPYVKLNDPPIEGVDVSADETYRMSVEAFDFDADTEIGIFVVKVGADELMVNGDFEDGATNWTIAVPGDWIIDNGVATHQLTTVPNTSIITHGVTVVAVTNYDLTFEVKNATAGTVTPTVGATGGTLVNTNGVFTDINIASGAGGNVFFTPSADFDGDIDNVSLKLNAASWVDGAATTTIGVLDALNDGDAYCLTSTDGTRALHTGGYTWLSDDTLADTPYYDVVLAVPGSATRYVNSLVGVVPMTDGDYWVYIGANTGTLLDNFGDGSEALYRAPGIMTITGLGTAATQRNLMIEPRTFVSVVGDTTTISVRAADETNPVDIIDLYIAVEKEFFDIIDSDLPFTDPAGFGSMIENETIDDLTNDRWILHTTLFNSGDTINPGDTGFGDEIASFRIVGKGTTNDTGDNTSIYYVNEPSKGWVTTYENDGVALSFGYSNANVDVQPRGNVHGMLSFQGRANSNYVVTFELRDRGSYALCDDSEFISANDGFSYDAQAVTLTADVYAPAGIQYELNATGDFKLTDIPPGDWDLAVTYNRYLAKLQSVTVDTGLDTLSVSFGELLGGDSIGYTDENNDAYPNNAINQDDIDRIGAAQGSTPASSMWATDTDPITGGKYNYKWADVNEDDVVGVADLTMATGNFVFGGSAAIGAQPVYQKPALQIPEPNIDAVVEFMNVPGEMIAGQNYTIQVVIHNAADVKGYSVDLEYNKEALTLAGIEKGDFINAESYSISSIGDGTVGLTNAVYGPAAFAGDGVLAEVLFTANKNGLFSADMLGITGAKLVDSNFIGMDIIIDSPSGINVETPVAFELGQNFPNPFNPTTAISFSIPKSGHVELSIYDILGRNVKTLVSGAYDVGNYSVVWDATDMNGNLVSNGVYFYTIKADDFRLTKKMLFMK